MNKRLSSFALVLTLLCSILWMFVGCTSGETQTNSGGNVTCEHKWNAGTVTVKSTCVTEGTKLYKCNLCEKTYTDSIPATGVHNYSESIVKNASCGVKGQKKYKCKDCSDYYVEDLEFKSFTASEIHEKTKKSVGEIITYNKSGNELALGSAFVYSNDGKIITNYHVIEDACSAKITLNGKEYQISSILAYDKDIDLAVLKINATNLNSLPTCANIHEVGKTVYAFGSSKGLTATFSQGIITYSNREIDGVYYVQHDAAISSGNSGGPLINEYSEVIGINTMTMRDSQNLNFAIAVSEISNLTYGVPLTFAEFYEKECDVYKKLKNYIISKGTYDSSDNDYTVSFLSSYWNSTHNYRTGARYDVTDDKIELTCFVYKYDMSYTTMSFLTIDKISSVYDWSFIDSDYNFMQGYIYPSSFTSSTVLSYSSKIGFTYTATTARQLASQLIYATLRDMKTDYSSIGIKASDLGFTNIA